jgi:hypothetical protein
MSAHLTTYAHYKDSTIEGEGFYVSHSYDLPGRMPNPGMRKSVFYSHRVRKVERRSSGSAMRHASTHWKSSNIRVIVEVSNSAVL